MSNRGEVPTVNAGSMADIAFLLLIFFLVTTSIETDAGMNRMLPRIDPSPPLPYQERNILLVSLNANNALMVDGELMDLRGLKTTTMAFLDNGGATLDNEGYCGYCKGLRSNTSSDNPSKAVVSLKSNRETSYGTYIAVQNELVAAYNELRNRESQRIYGRNFTEIELEYQNAQTSKERKNTLKAHVKKIQGLYPQKISEAEIN